MADKETPMHEISDRLHICWVCQGQCQTYEQFELHLQSHDVYICNFPHRSDSQKTKDRLIHCKLCKKKFKTICLFHDHLVNCGNSYSYIMDYPNLQAYPLSDFCAYFESREPRYQYDYDEISDSAVLNENIHKTMFEEYLSALDNLFHQKRYKALKSDTNFCDVAIQTFGLEADETNQTCTVDTVKQDKPGRVASNYTENSESNRKTKDRIKIKTRKSQNVKLQEAGNNESQYDDKIDTRYGNNGKKGSVYFKKGKSNITQTISKVKNNRSFKEKSFENLKVSFDSNDLKESKTLTNDIEENINSNAKGCPDIEKQDKSRLISQKQTRTSCKESRDLANSHDVGYDMNLSKLQHRVIKDGNSTKAKENLGKAYTESISYFSESKSMMYENGMSLDTQYSDSHIDLDTQKSKNETDSDPQKSENSETQFELHVSKDCQTEEAVHSVKSDIKNKKLKSRLDKVKKIKTVKTAKKISKNTKSKTSALESLPSTTKTKRRASQKCEVCGKVVQYCKMKMHLISHFDERPYACDICSKTYKYPQHLTLHKISHEEVLPYYCEVCGQGFISITRLKRHIMVHASERPFKCEVCGYGFITRFKLERHMAKHTGEKKTQCDQCGMRFKQKDNLKLHISNVHRNEKRFPCDECDKKFLTNYQLKCHKLKHAGIRPYKCTMCKADYIERKELRRHMKKVHKIDLDELNMTDPKELMDYVANKDGLDIHKNIDGAQKNLVSQDQFTDLKLPASISDSISQSISLSLPVFVANEEIESHGSTSRLDTSQSNEVIRIGSLLLSTSASHGIESRLDKSQSNHLVQTGSQFHSTGSGSEHFQDQARNTESGSGQFSSLKPTRDSPPSSRFAF